MADSQMLVRTLDGHTACLQFSSNTITGCRLRQDLSVRLGIPPDVLRIVTGTREITSHLCLQADCDGFFPSCNVLLRLRGGKGGFGSLLRGAATKAGQKKTSNFDACRDMSGRRLRHVNAEKKLKEWKAQAKDRELEKTANAFLKKQGKRKEVDTADDEEIQKFMAETSRAREEVESAVATGLTEAGRLFKKKKVESVSTNPEPACDWKADVDLEIENGIIKGVDLPIENGVVKEGLDNSECKIADGEGCNDKTDSAEPRNENVAADEDVNRPLNFDDFHAAADMQVLGLVRLKNELQARGLKCGGNLEERATRLFLLKNTPLEKLDKKHFAKSKGESQL